MTATEHGKVHPKALPEGDGFWNRCSCGEEFRGGNAGAVGFSLSAHVKKANGLPVFGPSKKTVEAAVAQLQREMESPEFARALADVDRMLGYTLPATLKRVASNEYRIHDYRSLRMRGADWDPFSAKLQRRDGKGWKTVATVEDEGRGGQWDIVFLDGKQLPGYALGIVRNARLFEVYSSIPMIDSETGKEVTGYERYIDVPSPESKRFVDWALASPGKDTTYDDEPTDWTPHAVVAMLIEEAEILKDLNGKRTRIPVLKSGEDPSRRYGTLGGGGRFDARQAAQWLKSHGEPNGHVWTDGAWRAVAEVLA